MFNLPFKKSMGLPKTVTTDLEYEDLIKVEFLDMIARFTQERKVFHIYAIGRCATTATLVGFSYTYSVRQMEQGCVIIKTIDLESYGKLEFEIKPGEPYGELITKNRVEVIQNLIDNFPTHTKVKNYVISNY